MTVVATIPLSESINGRPILVTPIAFPGTLLHRAQGTELHFLTIYISSRVPIDYSELVYVRLVKGTPSSGYTSDGLVKVIPDQKTEIEPGVLIQGSDVHIVIDSGATTLALADLELVVTGQAYVLSN